MTDTTLRKLSPSQVQPLYSKKYSSVKSCGPLGQLFPGGIDGKLKGHIEEVVRGSGETKWQGFFKIRMPFHYVNRRSGELQSTFNIPFVQTLHWDDPVPRDSEECPELLYPE